jgi:hypothetical protein
VNMVAKRRFLHTIASVVVVLGYFKIVGNVSLSFVIPKDCECCIIVL